TIAIILNRHDDLATVGCDRCSYAAKSIRGVFFAAVTMSVLGQKRTPVKLPARLGGMDSAAPSDGFRRSNRYHCNVFK
ncbi:MAG: hypothetical protein WAM06_09565, partial [Methyloceanibacter sp.]